jgi:hypothetical protein
LTPVLTAIRLGWCRVAGPGSFRGMVVWLVSIVMGRFTLLTKASQQPTAPPWFLSLNTCTLHTLPHAGYAYHCMAALFTTLTQLKEMPLKLRLEWLPANELPGTLLTDGLPAQKTIIKAAKLLFMQSYMMQTVAGRLMPPAVGAEQ